MISPMHGERMFRAFAYAHALVPGYENVWNVLSTWQDLSGIEFSETYFGKMSRLYHRDTDSDGLSDFQETELATNEFHLDTDGDRYSDFVEYQCQTNPLAAHNQSFSGYFNAPSCPISYQDYGSITLASGTTTRVVSGNLPPDSGRLLDYRHVCTREDYSPFSIVDFEGGGGVEFFVNHLMVRRDDGFGARYIGRAVDHVLVFNETDETRYFVTGIEFECTD